MEQLTDLKAILHSKRANIYYLEYCRILQKDGRVLYLTEADKQNLYYNIPIGNNLFIGTGSTLLRRQFVCFVKQVYSLDFLVEVEHHFLWQLKSND